MNKETKQIRDVAAGNGKHQRQTCLQLLAESLQMDRTLHPQIQH